MVVMVLKCVLLIMIGLVKGEGCERGEQLINYSKLMRQCPFEKEDRDMIDSLNNYLDFIKFDVENDPQTYYLAYITRLSQMV